jgi:hypothetical protein
LDDVGAMMKRLHDGLQFAAVAFGLLVVVSELRGWPVTLVLGLAAAVTAFAGYFTGKHTDATLERQIEMLETEQAGRNLSATQLQVLTEQLRTVQGLKQPVHLTGLDGDREAIRLAHVLKRAFESAGFGVDGVWEDGLIGGTGPGVLVRHTKIDGVVGQGIHAALQHAGLETRIVELGRDAGTRFEVIVGYKPI